MKIAFCGKGGSGKSTTCAIFIDYLQSRGQHVLAIDADINVHLASLLNVESTEGTALSAPQNVARIREHLVGTNPLIGSAAHMVKTTPPGPGSNALTMSENDPIVATYATPIGSTAKLMHVGTYEADGIGTSCSHVNLGILENMLSHFTTAENEWIVCDMVAGTDAFSNSLHAQFDAIVVVVEPTPEATSVARKYQELALAAGVAGDLAIVGNKVADEADLAYLQQECGESLLGGLPLQPELRRARQNGAVPRFGDLPDPSVLEGIEIFARSNERTEEQRLKMLHEIHRRLSEEDWIRNEHGDISKQIPVS